MRARSLPFLGGLGVFAIIATVLGIASLTSASACDNFSCPCTLCGAAIDLAVFDVDGNALDDGWTVEATVDGFAAENLSECDPDFRFGNACSFGTVTGMYRITLRGPNVQTREIVARSAARSGDDCCQPCINGTTAVDAFLEPLDDNGDDEDPEAQ